jgi:hypothetical protein
LSAPVANAGGNLARAAVGELAKHAAARVLAMRAALFLSTIEVSIFVLAVTILLWTFEDMFENGANAALSGSNEKGNGWLSHPLKSKDKYWPTH